MAIFDQKDWYCSNCKARSTVEYGWAAIRAGKDGVEFICISCFYSKNEDIEKIKNPLLPK